MKTVTIDGIKLLFFNHLSSYNRLFHAVSTRISGISPEPFAGLNLSFHSDDSDENILSNHIALSKALNFDLQTLVSSRQVHSNKVGCIDHKPPKRNSFVLEHTFDGFDALVTDQLSITLIVRVADCVPIILFDPVKTILAVVHAGWKGTVAGIAKNTVKKMVETYTANPSEIQAGIGPSIGPCCFRVKKVVADAFFNQCFHAERFVKRAQRGFLIDLREANRLQLIEQGCCERNIQVSDLCTACNSDLFFSYRREKGKTGRFGLLAGLRAG